MINVYGMDSTADRWGHHNWDAWAGLTNMPHYNHPRDCPANTGYYYLVDNRKVPPCFSECKKETQDRIIDILMLIIVQGDAP